MAIANMSQKKKKKKKKKNCVNVFLFIVVFFERFRRLLTLCEFYTQLVLLTS